MRKKIVAILLIATMAMGIAACGGSGDKKDDNTITVWCWDKTFNIFAMEEAAKIYQEDHQDVKIDIVEVGDVDVQSRLTTAGISGDLSTLPDVFLMLDQSFQKNVISYPDIFTEISEKKIDFSGTASELIEKLKSVSDETFYPNRVTRDLVRNGYTLRKYGIDFEYKRTRNCRLIILHYDRERDSSDSKNTSEVTVNRLTLKV